MLKALLNVVAGMSIDASLTATMLIPAKFILQKLSVPRKTLMLVWIVIALRLICPYAPESNLSVFNVFCKAPQNFETSIRKEEMHVMADKHTENFKPNPAPSTPKKHTKNLHDFTASIWLCGILAINGYSIFKTHKLKKMLRFSIKYSDNIYESDKITSSFILGFFKPKIYIPINYSRHDRENMIIHEQTHIKLQHNRLKIMAYIIMSVHWFNPFILIMFRLFSNDMEYVCDENVMDKVSKKSYVNSLLQVEKHCSTSEMSPDICLFSSLSKRRILNLINFKKCNVFSLLIGIIFFIIAVPVFNTDGIKAVYKPDYTHSLSSSVTKDNTKIQTKPDSLPTQVTSDSAYSVYSVEDKSDTQVKNLQSTKSYSGLKTEEKHSDKSANKKNNSEIRSETERIETEQSLWEFTDISDSAPLVTNMKSTPEQITKASMPENSNPEYKSNEKSDIPYGGFQLIENESIDENRIVNELKKNNISLCETDPKLSENYIKGDYVSSHDGTTVHSVSCDSNGNISVYINLNTESLFDINVYDSDTGDNVYQCNVLANNKNAFSMLGFDEGKKYNINIREITKGQWQTQGTYIIY